MDNATPRRRPVVVVARALRASAAALRGVVADVVADVVAGVGAGVGVVVAGVALLAGPVGCKEDTPVLVWVDGFQPENVRFEIEPLGPQSAEQLQAIKARPDVDGALLLPAGACPGPCRAALVSIFVNNRGTTKEPPPVVRLATPPGKERRLPIAYRGADIDPGRVGRIRWLVELHPEEQDLTVTLSPSVRFEATETPKPETPKPETPPQPPAPVTNSVP